MLQAFILICAAAVSDCSRATALDVLSTPIESASPVTCFMQAQAYVARTALLDDLGDGVQVQISCRRKG